MINNLISSCIHKPQRKSGSQLDNPTFGFCFVTNGNCLVFSTWIFQGTLQHGWLSSESIWVETEELLNNLNHCTSFGENRGCRQPDYKENPCRGEGSENVGQWSYGIYSLDTDVNAGSQLVSTLLFTLKLKCMRWHCPHLDWIFPGQLDLSRNVPMVILSSWEARLAITLQD